VSFFEGGIGSMIKDHISDAEQWEKKPVKILLLFAEGKMN